VETFVRDLAGGHTELVSRESGPDGAPATGLTSLGGVSAGAGCVTFYAENALIGEASDYGQVYLRARRGDCDPGTVTGADDDSTAPVVSGARLSRTRFRVGRARTAVAARRPGRGTVLRFRSTEAGTASIAFSRMVRGKRGRTRARAAGQLTRRIAAGPARIALSGRLGRRAMRVGRYRLTLTVRDPAGNASRPVRLRFRIAR